jgi:hypothetical protein
MPAGTMLFLTRKLPYPLANVGNVVQIRTRQDYYTRVTSEPENPSGL